MIQLCDDSECGRSVVVFLNRYVRSSSQKLLFHAPLVKSAGARSFQYQAPVVWNRRFPEITGKDNLTVFSYSGRMKSPE